MLVVELQTLDDAVEEALILERQSLGFLTCICLEATGQSDVTAGSARATTGTLAERELSSSSNGSALTLIFLSLHRRQAFDRIDRCPEPATVDIASDVVRRAELEKWDLAYLFISEDWILSRSRRQGPPRRGSASDQLEVLLNMYAHICNCEISKAAAQTSALRVNVSCAVATGR